MSIPINNIVRHLFQKDKLQQVSENELQQFVTDYPYASIGHLLLLKKRNLESTNGAADDLNKTSLYFRNPLWLQFLLSEPIAHEEKEKTVIAEESFTEEPAQQSTDVVTPLTSLHEEIVATDNLEPGSAQAEEQPTGVLPAEEKALPISEEAKNIQEPVSKSKPKIDSDELVFQSYHTIDYFASQGIKLQKAELTKDKLGHQLKSFTEWLKTMKRLPAPEAEAATKLDEATNASIQRIAQHSIEEKEVVTETMAEVWAKQGNKAKAWEIYHKLGLIYPDKRPYFAAKIEQLKDL